MPAHADLVFRGGNVLTLDRHASVASAVAVSGDRIRAVGGDAEVSTLAGPRTRIVELAGRTLMPGLTDGHAHLDREGLKGLLPSLAGCGSIRELVERLAAIAARTPPGAWIVTMPIGEPPEFRYAESMFEEGRLPDRRDLDRASTRHPILIRCAWGYWSSQLPLLSFANSAALAAAGVRKGTASPSPLVEIGVDAAGEPTGVIRDKAFQPIAEFTLFRAAPHFTEDDRARTLGESMRRYNAVGTTAVFEGHGAASEVVNAYRRVRAQDRQTVRATLTFSPGWSGASEADVRDWVKAQAPALRGRGEGDAWLRLAGFFAEVDPAPNESRLRAQCRPQTGWAGFNYDQGLPRDALVKLLRAAAKERLRVCAIQAPMLELFAEAHREAPIDGLRWVIAHPVTLDAGQVARIRDLGVCITTHTNAYLWRRAAATRDQVGREREETICPIRSLLEAGVCVSLGTDNVPVSLWPCVWQAVERIDRATGEVIAPGQRIGREEALKCASTHGAWLCLDEQDRGTLEPG
ncbi:MAG TPA: amidohydrolase family protein, partial [Burkholderiales bacterium]|nr:amidohydrolase family protein [Burkholderiales bacterium]